MRAYAGVGLRNGAHPELVRICARLAVKDAQKWGRARKRAHAAELLRESERTRARHRAPPRLGATLNTRAFASE